MRNLISSVFILVFVPAISFAGDSFRYVPTVGKCLNAEGKEGWNHPDVSAVFQYDESSSSGSPTISNKDLECADLSSINFRSVLKSDAGYVHLVNWNLKGARLSKSDVKWMMFVGGNLAGVNLTESTLGYTIFRSVQIDTFTHGLTSFCVSTAEKALVNCQM